LSYLCRLEGGFCPRGILSGRDYVQGDFVRFPYRRCRCGDFEVVLFLLGGGATFGQSFLRREDGKTIGANQHTADCWSVPSWSEAERPKTLCNALQDNAFVNRSPDHPSVRELYIERALVPRTLMLFFLFSGRMSRHIPGSMKRIRGYTYRRSGL